MNHLATALGLILGLVVGLVAAATDIGILDRLAEGVAPLGTLFINAIRMVVTPLVVTTIFVGVARLGNPKTVGKLGGSALGFFWGTTIPAIIIGMVFMRIALGIWPASVAGRRGRRGASRDPRPSRLLPAPHPSEPVHGRIRRSATPAHRFLAARGGGRGGPE